MLVSFDLSDNSLANGLAQFVWVLLRRFRSPIHEWYMVVPLVRVCHSVGALPCEFSCDAWSIGHEPGRLLGWCLTVWSLCCETIGTLVSCGHHNTRFLRQFMHDIFVPGGCGLRVLMEEIASAAYLDSVKLYAELKVFLGNLSPGVALF